MLQEFGIVRGFIILNGVARSLSWCAVVVVLVDSKALGVITWHYWGVWHTLSRHTVWHTITIIIIQSDIPCHAVTPYSLTHPVTLPHNTRLSHHTVWHTLSQKLRVGIWTQNSNLEFQLGFFFCKLITTATTYNVFQNPPPKNITIQSKNPILL